MILELGPDAPAIARAAAAAVLYTHIGGAAVGLVSGATAILARKGERLHRAAGNVFFVAMLAMAGVGAAVAPFLEAGRWSNTTAGLFTSYLVATAWVTVRRQEGRIGRFEVGALLLAAGIAVMGLTQFVIQFGGPRFSGFVPVFIFAAVAGMAAAFDFSMIRRGGLFGAQRITRHLWRMSLALTIAAGSFAGQPKAQPEFLKGSPILFLPMAAVLGLMIYWLIKVRFPRAPRPAVA